MLVDSNTDRSLLAADESLKFWKIFEKAKVGSGAGISGAGTSKATMAKQMTIR